MTWFSERECPAVSPWGNRCLLMVGHAKRGKVHHLAHNRDHRSAWDYTSFPTDARTELGALARALFGWLSIEEKEDGDGEDGSARK